MPRLLVTAAMVTLLCGCSTLYDNGLDYNQGWRQGKIVAMDEKIQTQSRVFLNCPNRAANAGHVGDHWLYVLHDFTRPHDKFFPSTR